MPITKSAKKALKVSRTKKAQNDQTKIALSKALKKTDAKNVSQTVSMIDKAAKRGVIAKNKAAHMKSSLSKKFSTPKVEKATAKSTVKPVKKSATKKPAVKKTAVKTKTK